MRRVSRHRRAPGNCRGKAASRKAASDLVRSSQLPRWPKRRGGRHAWAMSKSTTPEPASSGDALSLPDRRLGTADRRARLWRTLLVSSLAPRRRIGRRAGEQDLPVDFHEPYLLVLSIAMLVLSVADAFLTVTLLTHGAEETNPLLAFVLDEHPRLFAVVKMALTGFGVILLVALARTRVFKVVRADWFLTALAAAYLALVLYEAWLVTVSAARA